MAAALLAAVLALGGRHTGGTLLGEGAAVGTEPGTGPATGTSPGGGGAAAPDLGWQPEAGSGLGARAGAEAGRGGEDVRVPVPDAAAWAAWREVNQLRTGVGLPPLALEPALVAAARSHSEFMAERGLTGHYEPAGDPMSTGATPEGRALYWGYSALAGEVVLSRSRSPVPLIRQDLQVWLDSVYHRIPLLDPRLGAMGYGSYRTPDPDGRYVATVDFGWAPGPGLPAGVHPGSGAAKQPRLWPEPVLYPHPGQTDVPPRWRNVEEPDPLRGVSGAPAEVGYPITVSFFDGSVEIRVDEVALRGEAGEEVPLYCLDPSSDPLLRETVALIPARPLTPGTDYTVRVAGRRRQPGGQDQPFALTWQFRTADAPRVDELRMRYEREGNRWVPYLELTGRWSGGIRQLYFAGLPQRVVRAEGGSALAGPLDLGLQGQGQVVVVDRTGNWSASDITFLLTPAALTPRPGQSPWPGGGLPARVVDLGTHRWVEAGALSRKGYRITRQGDGFRWFLETGAHWAEVVPGLLVARVDGEDRLLASAPLLLEGELYLPAADLRDWLAAWTAASSRGPDQQGNDRSSQKCSTCQATR